MKVVILTEGTQDTGYGHLTRCLSLYQAFEEKGITPLFIANCDKAGKKYLNNVNLEQIEWMVRKEKLLEAVGKPDAIIIDSYLAGLDIYNELQSRAGIAAYIDDYLRISYPQGFIINGTIGAENLPYDKNGSSKLLLGVKYIPLRKEFWQVPSKQINSEIKSILLSFGGEDIRGLTKPVVEFLREKVPAVKLDVVIGMNSGFQLNMPNVNLHWSLSASEMLELMLENDLAIVAAGQTLYELVRIGIPTLAIGVADNQKYNLAGWENFQFIRKSLYYDSPDLYDGILEQLAYFRDKAHREKVYNDSRKFLDGQGALRIAENIIAGSRHE